MNKPSPKATPSTPEAASLEKAPQEVQNTSASDQDILASWRTAKAIDPEVIAKTLVAEAFRLDPELQSIRFDYLDCAGVPFIWMSTDENNEDDPVTIGDYAGPADVLSQDIEMIAQDMLGERVSESVFNREDYPSSEPVTESAVAAADVKYKKLVVQLTATQHMFFDTVIEVPENTTAKDLDAIYERFFRDAEFEKGDWSDGEAWAEHCSDANAKATRYELRSGGLESVGEHTEDASEAP